MAADTNNLTLVGRLTRDPELRSVGDTSVLGGRLAFTRREKRGGEWSDVSGFIDVTLAWGNRAEALAKYLAKGSRIAITGEIRWREYEKDGATRQVIDVSAREVQMLDSKSDGERRSESDMPAKAPAAESSDDDSDVPF